MSPTDAVDPFRELVSIMRRLRQPDGCPWDRKQTHQTLKQYAIEESHEVCEAVDSGDDRELCAELGDLLLQVVFHAQIASEEKRFAIDDVCQAICDKLIPRHPHVFGDTIANTPEEVLKNWERLKQAEKTNESETPHSLMDGIPRSLPGLQRAQRMQQKAAHGGFDWPSAEQAYPKILEEAREADEAMREVSSERLAEEIGDLLFSTVNFARLSGFRAEELMHRAAEKFESRFKAMESIVRDQGVELASMSLAEMDEIWNSLK